MFVTQHKGINNGYITGSPFYVSLSSLSGTARYAS